MIKQYTNPLLSGEPCMIDDSFTPSMDLFCSLLEKTGCKAVITSSFRKDANVSGAVVAPAKKSNHMVGRAIDTNLIDATGVHWNDEALKTPSGSVLDLIQLSESSGLRWGGRFQDSDYVHFDDAFEEKFPDEWLTLYNEIHQPAQPST